MNNNLLMLLICVCLTLQGADDKKDPSNKTLATPATMATTAASTTVYKPCGTCAKCTGLCERCHINQCYRDGAIMYGLCSECMKIRDERD